MRDLRVVGAGSDGVPREMFTGDTARMNREAQQRLTTACGEDDAIPSEMVGGETTRIDQAALSGLIEKSEGVALGTPKLGMPALADDDVPIEVEEDDAVPVAVAPARESTMPVKRSSRVRDVLIGGAISIAAMAAWFCATQL